MTAILSVCDLEKTFGSIVAARDITLPKRQKADGYREPALPLKYIPTPF